MKAIAIVALFAAFAVATAVKRKRATKFRENDDIEITENPHEDLENYLEEHHPTYNPDEDHHERVANFFKIRQDILEHDPDEAGYSKGFTKFSFMTAEEVADQWNHIIGLPDKSDNPPGFKRFHQYTERDLEEARGAGNVDWRANGAVSSVKDQGGCGSCYTFAAAAALEGQVFRQQRMLLNLSTQQYVDCALGYSVHQEYTRKGNGPWVLVSSFAHDGTGNNGCHGGLSEYCWSYNNLTSPQASWECYGYTSGKSKSPGSCKGAGSCNVKINVAGYVAIADGDENALMTAVANVGPVACGVDANSLQHYTGGILDAGTCSKSANHAVTVVGYGTDASLGQDYWLIKNSWGPAWGEKGYFRIPRGINACGVASNGCVYPTLH